MTRLIHFPEPPLNAPEPRALCHCDRAILTASLAATVDDWLETHGVDCATLPWKAVLEIVTGLMREAQWTVCEECRR